MSDVDRIGIPDNIMDRMARLEQQMLMMQTRNMKADTLSELAEAVGGVNSADITADAIHTQADVVDVNWWMSVGLSDDDVTNIFAIVYDAINGYIYIGGQFARIGGVASANIARYDLATRSWSALGAGLNSVVYAIAIDGAGNLYIGGSFTDAGGIAAADKIAKWDGANYTALGSGLNSDVYAIAIDASGNIYAGGFFTDAGGVAAADKIAKWDGANWTALGAGLNSPVQAIAIDSTGNLYIGGSFTDAGGIAEADYIVKWDGANYIALGNGLSNTVYALALDSFDNIIAAGTFLNAGDITAVDRIAKWDGEKFSALANNGISGLGGYVRALFIDGSGNIWAGGAFSNAGTIIVNSLAVYIKPLSDAIDLLGNQDENYAAWLKSIMLPLSYLDTDGTLAANSDVKVPSQKAIKTYVNTADAAIAANVWTLVPKAAGTVKTSDTTLANDPDLIFQMAASTKYSIRGKIFFHASAAGDFKFRFLSGGSPTTFLVKIRWAYWNGTAVVSGEGFYIASPTTTIVLTDAAAFDGVIELDADIAKEAAVHNFSLQWAQNTSSANGCIVYAESYMEYKAM